MKISLNWLKDYVNVTVAPEKLAHALTMAGLEVEKIHSVDGDTVFEIEVTPNRPDCLNMLGIAREVGAVFNKKYMPFKQSKLRFPAKKCDISILDKKGCTRYIGTVIEGVSVMETPAWIKKRITALGLRSINNIVDITNFCLLETGQPMHAFDLDKLAGRKIIVRRARKGEKIITIDGDERVLDESILIIADEQKPVAIAGVMGGKDTEVTEKTKNILLESAYFDPILIRRAARKLGLSSDSSYRFERGVDWDMVKIGAGRAVDLILESAKGKVVKYRDVVTEKRKTKVIDINITGAEINSYLGVDIKLPAVSGMLHKLDFKISKIKANGLKVTPPTFRNDVKSDKDVIEEVARIYGYENIPTALPQIKATEIPENSQRRIRNKVRECLLAQGYSEMVTYAMTNRAALAKSNLGNVEAIKIKNPLTQDQEFMRPSVLPLLLSVAATNINRGNKDFKLFEIGKIYTKNGERDTLGIIAGGVNIEDWRVTQKLVVDFYDIKGAVEAIACNLGVGSVDLQDCQDPYFDNTQAAGIYVAGEKIGVIGKIDREVLDKWDIKQNSLYFVQVDFGEFYRQAQPPRKFKVLNEYPAAVHDISLAVKDGILFRQVKDIARREGGEILTGIEFKEQYLGEKLPPGCRGVIFSLQYQSFKRTLTDEEIKFAQQKIIKALADELGAIQR